MENTDADIPDDSQEIDLQSLKRAMMRRDEAVERFRAAKQQMLRPRSSEDVRRQDQAPDQR
ncbi:MAG TPA: hypothetical protein VFE23_02345 [Usitatibacter sp.]|jgi:hypothetical protein|nr:hypothetical protein [Usitatibacter sp.]